MNTPMPAFAHALVGRDDRAATWNPSSLASGTSGLDGARGHTSAIR